jgi:hypothetical protein
MQYTFHHCSPLPTHISKEHAILVKKYEAKRDLEMKGTLRRENVMKAVLLGL